VDCRADEIYFGLKNFSARRNANNFTEPDLADGAKYAHEHGVKLYAAFNTLVFDNEFSELRDSADIAAKYADGFIVQDMGAASVLREYGLPLHASTQATITSSFGVKYAADNGFSRAVLARELNKTQLAEICSAARELSIETEVFVLGAQCAGLSGQCRFSAFFGGDKIRSANRGLCAQPCRLAFKGDDNKYALSAPDLYLLEHLAELQSMGVTAAKIEGRMKSADYVRAAVIACVNARDNTLGSGDIAALNKAFTRTHGKGFRQSL
jgi:putative protease